jgi:MscS family membrane protein
LKIVIVIVSVLFIGQTILELNITALLAGAGVVGLAVAFAAQDTIANFFGSIMIILDHPFKVGERIDIGSHNGIVEHVGFRSTRMRTLDDHGISVPNKELASCIIENIAKRQFLKYSTTLGLTYDTTPEKMEEALDILHTLLDNHEARGEERPPRIVFDSFGDWSLNIGITCWYCSDDYGAFKLWSSKMNLEILKRFNAAGLNFAFPTNTTYIAQESSEQITVNMNEK